MKLFRTTDASRGSRPRWEVLTKATIYGGSAGRADRRPLLTRYRILQTPLFGLYVHQHHRADHDRNEHDHPWPFLTYILRGGYYEQWREQANRPEVTYRAWGAHSLHLMRLRNAHRIDMVLEDTWTAVLVGRKQQDWGYWVHGDQLAGDYPGAGRLGRPIRPYFVPWRTYIAHGGTPDPFDC